MQNTGSPKPLEATRLEGLVKSFDRDSDALVAVLENDPPDPGEVFSAAKDLALSAGRLHRATLASVRRARSNANAVVARAQKKLEAAVARQEALDCNSREAALVVSTARAGVK
jgi:hypothetical protein